MTLVELLVVMTIILLLAAVAVPRMRPALEAGRVRESARQLNAFLAAAKARAVQLGRPAGIWIARSEQNPNVAFEVYRAEMPPPYSGDFTNATVAFRSVNGRWVAEGFGLSPPADAATRGFTNSSLLVGLNPQSPDPELGVLAHRGESFQIRFNFQGPAYACTRGSGANSALFVMEQFFVPPPGANGDRGETGMPYQIYLAPKRASGRPLQFAGNSIIDLEFSGLGLDFSGVLPTRAARWNERINIAPPSLALDRGVEFAALNDDRNGNQQIEFDEIDRTPVVIMFTPGGSIERYIVQGRSYVPVGTVHLLVGSTSGQERTESPVPWSTVDTSSYASELMGTGHCKNIEDPESIWISIGHRTGAVSSTPNGWVTTPIVTSSLRLAREFGQSGQTMGGR